MPWKVEHDEIDDVNRNNIFGYHVLATKKDNRVSTRKGKSSAIPRNPLGRSRSKSKPIREWARRGEYDTD